MSKTITVSKQTNEDGTISPDTTSEHWQKVSETATEMTIEVMDE